MSQIQDTVSLTSRYMAVVRAVETQRPNRLFADPLAAHLAGTKIMAEIADRVIQKHEEEDREFLSIVIRTRFFDDFLMSSTQQIRQVVILGAGMDARAFRLNFDPSVHLYELDRLPVIQTKEFLLGNILAKCDRSTIPVDLRESWSDILQQNGFQPNIPTAWLMEGLLYYLHETEVHQLLDKITQLSAAGSCLGADFLNTQATNFSTSELAKYWHFGCDRPETFLAEYGWHASVVQPGDKTANYQIYHHRFPPREVPDVARLFFVTAIKQDRSPQNSQSI